MVPQKSSGRAGTNEKLVETARGLFSRHGIKRVTVDEICRESGVSKMTFYRHFPDKTAIAMRILEDITAAARRSVREIEMLDIPFADKLRKILEMRMEHARSYSEEFLGGLIKDADPALELFLEEEKLKSLQEVRDVFVVAQRMGEIRRDVKADLLIHAMGLMQEALGDEGLRNLYPDDAALAQDIFNLFYHGAARK